MKPNNAQDAAPNAPPQRVLPSLPFQLSVELLPALFQGTDTIDLINFTCVHPAAAQLIRFLPSQIDHIVLKQKPTRYKIWWETVKIKIEVDIDKYNSEYLASGRTRFVRDVSVGYHTEPPTLKHRNAQLQFIVCKTSEERKKVFQYFVKHLYQMTKEQTLIDFNGTQLVREDFSFIFGITTRFRKFHVRLPNDTDDNFLHLILGGLTVDDMILGGGVRHLVPYTGAIKPTSLSVAFGLWLTAQSVMNMETKNFFGGSNFFTGRDIRSVLEAWKNGGLQNLTTMCLYRAPFARIRNYNSVIVYGMDAERWHAPFVCNYRFEGKLLETTWCMRNVNGVLAMVGIDLTRIDFEAFNQI